MSEFVERWMPSPFVFAILLTYIVFVGGLATGSGPVDLLQCWYDGFWAFLGFSMQMVLILMTGFVIAYHPRVNDLLQRLARVPATGAQAAAFVGFISMSLAWIHWGFSLIMGAIFAREMGKAAHEEGIDAHYPLLAVGGYMGLGLTWHWGLSASAPLQLTDANNIGEGTGFDFLTSTIPAAETIFHPYAIALTILSIIFATLVLYVLSPSGDRAKGITEYVDEDELFDATGGGAGDEAAAEAAAEMSADEQAALETLGQASVDTASVALNDDVEVDVKRHLNADIEDRFDAISDADELAAVRDDIVVATAWLVDDEHYGSERVWQAYVGEYGTGELFARFMEVAGPALDRLAELGEMEDFRREQ